MSAADIPGPCFFEPLYREFVEKAKDGAIAVEVGVALGRSIAYLARLVIDSGKDIEIWGVDPWEGQHRNWPQREAFGAEHHEGTEAPADFLLFLDMMNARAREELGRVRVVRATSVQASWMFPEASIDLVLLDGAHDYKSVITDIAAWTPKLKHHGVLAGDDYRLEGVQKAVHFTFGEVELSPGPWPYWVVRM